MQDYRRLRVHESAHALAIAVRAATRRFPRSGYTSLKNQMTSAAESISFNIVEGCGADSQKDFARFLEIAIKSSTELENQLKLSKDYGILTGLDWDSLSETTVDVRKMLCGLRKRVRTTIPPEGGRHATTVNGATVNSGREKHVRGANQSITAGPTVRPATKL